MNDNNGFLTRETHVGTVILKVSIMDGLVHNVSDRSELSRINSTRLDATLRLVNLALEHRVHIDEIIGQLEGITDEPIWYKGRMIRSPEDAIADILKEAIKELDDPVC